MTTNNRRNDSYIQRALALRTHRAVKEHLDELDGATRLALEEGRQEIRAVRDDMAESLLNAVERQTDMVEQSMRVQSDIMERFATMLTAMQKLLSEGIQVNIPRQITPIVNVDVKGVEVPPAQVIIEPAEKKAPTTTKVRHSDGTVSTIEFSD